METGNQISFETVQPGDVLPEARIAMSAETYFEYNRLVNELNPLHFDRPYAQKLGYRDIVVAGVYTFSFIPQMVENWAGDAGRVNTIDVRYHNPVYIGETVVQTAQVIDKSQQDSRKTVVLQVLVKNSSEVLLTTAMVEVSF